MSDLRVVHALVASNKTTWITREQWRAMLFESRSVHDQIKAANKIGEPTEQLWRQLRPINATIRSGYLKVEGIDDRPTRKRFPTRPEPI